MNYLYINIYLYIYSYICILVYSYIYIYICIKYIQIQIHAHMYFYGMFWWVVGGRLTNLYLSRYTKEWVDCTHTKWVVLSWQEGPTIKPIRLFTYTFDIWSSNQNHAWILGLSRNLFRILYNVPSVIGIMRRGNDWKCGIYVPLVLIDLRISSWLWINTLTLQHHFMVPFLTNKSLSTTV